jgi:hypothetical protein
MSRSLWFLAADNLYFREKLPTPQGTSFNRLSPRIEGAKNANRNRCLLPRDQYLCTTGI